MSLTAGRRLGSYEVLTALGEGGMGEVYHATDTRLGRDVAAPAFPEGDTFRVGAAAEPCDYREWGRTSCGSS